MAPHASIALGLAGNRPRPFGDVFASVHCLRPYLEIEKARLGERLRIVEDVEAEAIVRAARGAAPQVESAVRHGIAPRAAPGQVTIAAAMERASAYRDRRSHDRLGE
jgi:LytS/YehU family sensor histidine kinase